MVHLLVARFITVQHKLLAIISLLALLCAGCASPAQRAPATSSELGAADLRHAIDANGSATFRTHNGQLVGGDSDAELTLFRDGSAYLFDWGFAPDTFTGNYHIHPDGCVVIWLKDYRGEWPVMVSHRDADALRLRPLNPPVDFPEETREAIADLQRSSFWNFRQLTGDEERNVLKNIEADRASTRPVK
jgi:hypothetical protein